MPWVLSDCMKPEESVATATKYYVKRASGKVLGPFPTRVIQQMIRSKQVAPEAEVSADKVTFTPVSEHPDFASILDEKFTGQDARVKTHAKIPSDSADL